MEPLRQWTCDVCGDSIEHVDQGYVVWRRLGPGEKQGDYRILHQSRCDPGSKDSTLSLPLGSFLGEDGLAMLLSWLSPGPIHGPFEAGPDVHDFDEYVDLVRRVHTPYYEEARRHFSDEGVQQRFGDTNEYLPYRPDSLSSMAEEAPDSG